MMLVKCLLHSIAAFLRRALLIRAASHSKVKRVVSRNSGIIRLNVELHSITLSLINQERQSDRLSNSKRCLHLQKVLRNTRGHVGMPAGRQPIYFVTLWNIFLIHRPSRVSSSNRWARHARILKFHPPLAPFTCWMASLAKRIKVRRWVAAWRKH